ncbi:MAG: 2-oxo acid dehydrogenase subunit E2 [Myxococcaceae bacterium]|nr:2-oxo acid dehydrogenase subunit E2 [Myxococcaceae bacterium]MCI0668874.1 2-oxo acid dehydrogenase subunit E2 [Myxococcaceae bacterium]
MATFEFKLPDLGEGVVEGEIVKWLVKEGDVVHEDQGVLEVMTDKATVTVPTPRKGKVLKVLGGKEGDMAKVHTPLVLLEVEGAAGAQPAAAHGQAAAPAAASAQAAPAAAAAVSTAKVLATPVTRRMAREHGIDLGAISGTGPQGRVTKADLQAAMGGGGPALARAEAPVVPLRPVAPAAPLAAAAEDQRIPLRGLRKKIAEKMVRSRSLIPDFAFVEEVDCSELVALRKRINAQLAAQGETTKLTFLPFIVKATIAALRRFPHLNSNFDEAAQELVVRGQFNIGFAVATDDGLTVPVLKGVDRMSIRTLAEEIARLAAAARDRKLKMEELTGGTFTITSLGQSGGLFATPIINHPEVGILGIHKMKKRPVVVDDEVVVREMMNVSLSCDHRVIDGQVGADFTYEVIRYLEHPETLFLEMT